MQTPLLGQAADGLRIGDRVWFRHAKAGELCERFAELHLIDGDTITATVPTYRGEGQAFALSVTVRRPAVRVPTWSAAQRCRRRIR